MTNEDLQLREYARTISDYRTTPRERSEAIRDASWFALPRPDDGRLREAESMIRAHYPEST